MQDVAEFVRRKGLALNDYFDPSRSAVIDDEHLARINYESFFFADTEARAVFLEDPIRYCGLVTDPVTKRRFRPRPTSLRAEYEGVLYLFESRTGLSAFERMPQDFVRPGYRM